MQVVKVKGRQKKINDNYRGKKQEEQLWPLGLEENPSLKSLPQSEGQAIYLTVIMAAQSETPLAATAPTHT